MSAGDYQPTVGLQTWTCRFMSFDEMVNFAVEHHIKYVQLIPNHLNPAASLDEARKKKAILDAKGLVCYTFGVSATSMDKEKNRRLFELAKVMGAKVIVVEPKKMEEWDNLEELVKEYDIKLAIHNHGKDDSVYRDPATVKAVLAKRDKRIGVCMDVGWVTAAGFDAAKAFREYDGRVYDMHLKDKRVEKANGKTDLQDVAIGTGQTNYKALFAEMRKVKWTGVMSIETDNATFAKSPAEFVDGAIKFVKDNNP